MQVIRPGNLSSNFIRLHGLKEPTLVKGDAYTYENLHLGVHLPENLFLTVDSIVELTGGDRTVSVYKGISWS
jgi:hypothetical protein